MSCIVIGCGGFIAGTELTPTKTTESVDGVGRGWFFAHTSA